MSVSSEDAQALSVQWWCSAAGQPSFEVLGTRTRQKRKEVSSFEV